MSSRSVYVFFRPTKFQQLLLVSSKKERKTSNYVPKELYIFHFQIHSSKEFVPLVPAKSGSKCIAMEIFSESSKMLYLYFAHSSFFKRSPAKLERFKKRLLVIIIIIIIIIIAKRVPFDILISMSLNRFQ